MLEVRDKLLRTVGGLVATARPGSAHAPQKLDVVYFRHGNVVQHLVGHPNVAAESVAHAQGTRPTGRREGGPPRQREKGMGEAMCVTAVARLWTQAEERRGVGWVYRRTREGMGERGDTESEVSWLEMRRVRVQLYEE